MKRLANRIAILVALLTVALSNGWHLPVVQGFAWIQMFQVYNEKVSASEALEIIFSGKKPCCICQFVQSCKQESQKTWNHWQSKKMVLILQLAQQLELTATDEKRPTTGTYAYFLPSYFKDQITPPPKKSLS